MFFPRKPGLRRNAQKPRESANHDGELRPKFNLSKLELTALLLMR